MQLQRWWEQKYKLPSNHELFLSKSPIELLIEYWQDVFEDNPIEVHRQDDGEIQFTETGDSFIDQWEAQMARGETPDLSEVLDPEAVQKLRKMREKKQLSPAMSFKDAMDLMTKQAQEEGLAPTHDPRLDAIHADWRGPFTKTKRF